MKIVINIKKPRNQLVALTRSRKAGKHTLSNRKLARNEL